MKEVKRNNPATRRAANFVAALLPFACVFGHASSHAANNAITEQEYLQDLPVVLTQQLGHDMQFSAGYYHQHPLPILNASQATVMRRMDLRLAKPLAKSAYYSGGEIAVVVQNAFQSDYAEYSTTPQTNSVKLFNKLAFVTATLNFR